MTFYILFGIAMAAAIGATLYDETLTEKGLKAGVGLEANSWLIGDKPSWRALFLRDMLETAFIAAPAIISHVAGSDAAAYGFLAVPTVAVVKHIRGARQWAFLLAGGKLSNAPLSAWQKFLS